MLLPDMKAVPGARPSPQPDHLRPQLALLAGQTPEGDEWLHEIKFDGYRLMAHLKNGGVRLVTRGGHDWTARFQAVRAELAGLPVGQAVLDGEAVVLDERGVSTFEGMQKAMSEGRGEIVYYVFDIVHLNGFDLSRCPLVNRKELLRQVLEMGPGLLVRLSDHIRGKGRVFREHACRHGLEGVVSKKAGSVYEDKRAPSWIKSRCGMRQEFVVGGYTNPGGSRTAFGALLLGYYDDSGRFIHCGRVGAGFDERLLRSIHARLREMERPTPAFDNPPKGAQARGAHWVEPSLVAEVAFTGWTGDGVLRHPSFKGMRSDKDPREVRREEPDMGWLPGAAPPAPPGAGAGVGIGDYAASRLGAGRSASRAGERAAGSGTPSSRKAAARSGGNGGDGEPRPRAKAAAGLKGRRETVAGVSLSNPGRVLYPEMGLTKRDLAGYFASVGELIMPHVARRPLMILRCPQGRGQECFYQKHQTDTLPDSVHGIPIREGGDVEDYIAIDSVEGLVALVQMGMLEIHAWASPEDSFELPDRVIFDLDPGPGFTWREVVDTAVLLKNRLLDFGLESFPKLSGNKGVHVYAPIAQGVSWDEAKDFARAVARFVERADPSRFTTNMKKDKRQGRAFLDYLRTGRGATCVAAYSTRARAGAPVSVPVTWKELPGLEGPAAFTVANLPERLARLRADPWEGFFRLRQPLTADMVRQAVKQA